MIKTLRIFFIGCCVCAMALAMNSCMSNDESIQITDLQRHEVKDIPGASGIVRHHGKYWVVGDDAASIYVLNKKFKIVNSFQIPSMSNKMIDNGRIAKVDKADLEALTVVNKFELVAFGSGSKGSERETFIRILGKKDYTLEEYSLRKFYAAVRRLPAMNKVELNIEAAAILGKKLYLFNRQNNLMISLSYKDFVLHVSTGAPVPNMETYQIKTPKLNGLKAGISGASFCTTSGRLFLTASVEDTENAVADGKIHGSFVGSVLLHEIDHQEIVWLPIEPEGQALKVESVEVLNEKSPFRLIFAVDNDNGKSLLLELNFETK